MKIKTARLTQAVAHVSLGALLMAPLQAQQSSFPTVQLPPGFRIEKVVDGLTYPTSLAWDNEGRMYVVEAGGQFLEEPPPPRILRIEGNRAVEVVNLADKGIADSAVGLTWHNGAFLITHREPSDRTGAVSRVTLTGTVTRLITGIIDSQAEHQVNSIRVGPDGRVYFASGPAANSGVVGIDLGPFVARSPMVRTTPCVDYVLTGVNFATPNFRTPAPDDIAMTGGFVPFGTMTTPGQRIRGTNKCGGAILSFDPNSNAEGTLRPYAHGFRNVIGMAWDSRGEMFAAVNGYDVRGSRPVNDQFDATYKVRENMWYGWPDFSAALEPVTDAKFDSPESLKAPVFIGSMAQSDKKLRFLIDHAASNLMVADRSLIAGLHEIGSSPSAMDIAPASMGTMAGQIFVAEWGDLAPATNPLLDKLTGYQVVRIDPVSRRAVPFARNVRSGPASGQGAAGMGLERPFDVKFGPDGAMYIVDYGIARVNPARVASGQVPYEFPPQTGAIWKITGAPTNAPAITAVMSANADFASPAVAPGSLIRLFGSNLAAGNSDLSGFTGSTLPTTLNNVRVTIAGRPAPVIMVSPTAIVAQVPFETPRGSQPVVVTSGTAMSQSLDVLVTEVAPAVLFDETGGFIVKNSDFSRVRADSPARAGDVLLLYSTGLGLNSSRLQTGALVARDARIDTQPVTVTIGGQPAEVIYSIASPGFAGLFQTAVRVPSGLPGSTAPVVLRAGTSASNTVNLAIAGISQGERFEITVVNLTTGQTFTPILAASHGQGARLFDEGQPATQQLEILAEEGATAPLKSLLAGNPLVRDITDTGMNPLPPGQSVTLTVRTEGAFDHISVAAMLVPTNDAFFAINGMRVPAGADTATFEAVAYDAGTEANDERCASIPGPPNVCQGEGFNPSRAGAEGTVQMHGGIRGVGDLNAVERNWRNPVARVTVRRLR